MGTYFDEYFQTLTLVVSVFENRIEVAKMGKIDINKVFKTGQQKFLSYVQIGIFR